MVDLNKLAAVIHEAAVKKGFWSVEEAEEKHLAKMISELGEVVQADRAGIMYEVEHEGAKPEGVVAELADFVMMALDFFVQTEIPFSMLIGTVDYDNYRGSIGKDVADIAVYKLVMLLDLSLNKLIYPEDIDDMAGSVLVMVYGVYNWAEIQGFDLWSVIRQKMAYNESRPALHGRLY